MFNKFSHSYVIIYFITVLNLIASLASCDKSSKFVRYKHMPSPLFKILDRLVANLNFPVVAENVPAFIIHYGDGKSSPGVPATCQLIAAAMSPASTAYGTYIMT